MSQDTYQRDSTAQLLRQKDEIIRYILQEEDLYKILAAKRTHTPSQLRKCYLDRSKICHPDKLPFHPLSTAAFQRLGLAYSLLSHPTTRTTYNTTPSHFTDKDKDKPSFLPADSTFRTAILSILHDFLTGDITPSLESLHGQYPHLISTEVVENIENAFEKVREAVGTTRVCALLVYGELKRVRRVQRQLWACRWWDVVGRVRLGVLLVRVALAVPCRVDRALRGRGRGVWRGEGEGRGGGILNERVCKVLEWVVGEVGWDDVEGVRGDDIWGN